MYQSWQNNMFFIHSLQKIRKKEKRKCTRVSLESPHERHYIKLIIAPTSTRHYMKVLNSDYSVIPFKVRTSYSATVVSYLKSL